MANPQKENGFTSIANEILEALYKCALNGTEWDVVMCVLRQTYGYQKKEDWISYTQFEKHTGKSRPAIWKAIESLVNKRLLVNRCLPGRTIYSLNKDHSQWLVNKRLLVNKQKRGSKQTEMEVVNNRLLTKESITKESITKENIQKKILVKEFNPEVKKLAKGLLDCILFNNEKFKHDARTLPRWEKEIDLMMRVDKRTFEEIKKVIKFSQSDNFWKTNILSAKKLREKFDQLWIKAKTTNSNSVISDE